MPIRESETFIREQSGNFFSDKSGNPVIVLDGYFPFITTQGMLVISHFNQFRVLC